MIFLYLAWALRISTATTMVFCILVETTCPTFSLRREMAGACSVSLVAVILTGSLLSCRGRCVVRLAADAQFTFTGNGLDLRNLPAKQADLLHAIILAKG